VEVLEGKMAQTAASSSSNFFSAGNRPQMWNSPEYAAPKALRQRYFSYRHVLVEGVDFFSRDSFARTSRRALVAVFSLLALIRFRTIRVYHLRKISRGNSLPYIRHKVFSTLRRYPRAFYWPFRATLNLFRNFILYTRCPRKPFHPPQEKT